MEADICEEFKQEAQELLASMEAALLDLENAPCDAGLINKVFRALHTLKGSSGMFGFDAVSAFAHHVETAFDLMRQGQIPCTPELIAATLRAQDYMQSLINSPDSANEQTESSILETLRRLSENIGQTVPALTAMPEKCWRLLIRFNAKSGLSDTALQPCLDELRALGQAVITPLTGRVPPFNAPDQSQTDAGWEVMLKTAEPRLAIENVFMFVPPEVSLEIEELASTSDIKPAPEMTPPTTPPDPAAAGQAVTAAQGVQAASPGHETFHHPEAAHAEGDGQGHPPFPRAGATAEHSIRVPAERLDELMNRVGELVIAQSRLRQIAASTQDQQVKSVAEEIERLVLELRDTSMGIRMVPIAQLFNRFRRVVHDLSHDLGKHVELTMVGEETELDKTVIEQLNDPIVHLIRNAIDHGIEAPEVRAQAGKTPAGAIKLSARHAGTEVLVTIADDGRGLDLERIRARAEERGLIPADAVVSDAELYQFLFLPGFSTASEVTSLSGRGVGMDVVKRTIEALRGKIDVQSTLGTGTQITLRLPLTLAIIDGLMVRVGHGRYVLPLEAVEECVELSAEEDTRSRGRCFLNIRGDLVPFLRLRELFSAKTPPDRFQKVVVVSSGELKVGLVVDQVIGDHQTVIKSLSKLHRDIEMFSGATILGDGAVALILDVPHLVEYGQMLEERQKAAG